MRIGFYIRRLSGLGGGERHALAIAETLAIYHPVELITNSPIPAARLRERFNTDLSNIHIRNLPERTDAEMSAESASYDLFINSLHNTFFPSRAKHSAMLIFFPIQADLPLDARIRRTAAHWINQQLLMLDFQSGVYAEERENDVRLRHLDTEAIIATRPVRQGYQINFGLRNRTDESRNVAVWFDQTLQTEVELHAESEMHRCSIDVPSSQQHRRSQQQGGHRLRLEVHNGSDEPLEGISGVQLVDLRTTHHRNQLYDKLFIDWFPTWRERLLNAPPNNLLDAVATYDIVWANSEFSRTWARTYWKRDCNTSYPRIHVEQFYAAPKKQQIVSVGRFFREGHNKKHLYMVQAFKELVDEGLTDWSLHLAGGVIQEQLHLDYVDAVREAAAGYPIEIHVDLPFEQLRTLYAESAIYWHAAGYGESATREPVKLEHFGITTVESMASGCVPVVIALGGQIEVLDHGESGFHWQTLDELKSFTLQLAHDEALRTDMSRAAIERSQIYNQAHFEERLLDSLEAIGCDLRG